MDALIKRRAVIKGQLTKLTNYAKTCDENTAFDDMQARLEKLKDLYNGFVSIQDEMFSIKPSEQSDIEVVDENYYFCVATLQRLMRKNIQASACGINDTTLNSSSSGPKADVKLPRLTLPTFSGKAREWQSFYDLFVSTVHSNTSLSPAQKFQYLLGQLRGPPEALVRHFRVDDASYIEAFQKLVKRYDRKRMIVNEFIEAYLKQTPITKPSVETVGRVYDTCDEVIRGLKALGSSAESRDCWLVHLAETKLDDVTLQLWRQESSENDFPTINDFLEFLSKRMNALEGVKQLNSRVQSKSFVPAKTFHIESKSQPRCPLCSNIQHRLCDCPKFISMSLDQRRLYLKQNSRCFNCLADAHFVFQCKSKGRCHQCRKRHHTLVHDDLNHQTGSSESEQLAPTSQTATANATTVFTTSQKAPPIEISHAKTLHTSQPRLCPDALLPTAMVEVLDRFGKWRLCRALLDSASSRSYISENCANRLNIVRSNARFNINTLNGGKAGTSKGVSSLLMRSRTDNKFTIDLTAYVIPKITTNLPPKYIANERFSHLNKLVLADPGFYTPGTIDILIGCDKFLVLLSDGQIRGDAEQLVAQNTRLGWIIGGEYVDSSTLNQANTCLSSNTEINLDQTLRKFWETEEILNVESYTDEEARCIEHFEKHMKIESSGKFTVALPFKSPSPVFGDSLNQAIRRFGSLEQKLLKNPELRKNYCQFMMEYESLGHMELVPTDEVDIPNTKRYYLPHHPVIKETSSTTKLRVVFDASAKSTSGVSLNDSLMVGPTIQQTLVEILIRFRKHRYILTADVEKMFRQLWIQKSDTEFQRIIWRDSPDSSLKHYRLLTNTYGTASASFIATKALSKLAQLHRESHPIAADILSRDFYMDDLMSGAHTIREATTIQTELISLMELGGYHLRKWAANDARLLESIPEDDRELSIREINEGTKLISVLGIKFDPRADCFSIKVSLTTPTKFTKRIMLSEASSVYDPLGWLSPVTVGIKILFQSLWLRKLDWDDELPPDIIEQWTKIRGKLNLLEELKIPRWLALDKTIQLCGFADASNAAYAAVIYARSVNANGGVSTNIIAAKTKVSPIKYTTTARLELCAALLLVRLLALVQKSLELGSPPKVALYSDSTTVLAWLANPPRKGNIFVLNRVTQILNETNVQQWSYTPSKQNPADVASRGCLPGELLEDTLWWKGPEWLRIEPVQFLVGPRTNKVVRTVAITNFAKEESNTDDGSKMSVTAEIIDKFSSFNKSIRVLAWVNRAKHNFQRFKARIKGPLSAADVYQSYKTLLQEAQHSSFAQEISSLRNGIPLKNSNLSCLSPFLDKTGTLRVGGRLENANENYNLKHPIILSGKHHLSHYLVREMHEKNMHAGPTLLMAIIKQQYAILRCKDLVRRTIHQCITCFRQKGITEEQLMGQLPPPRVNLIRVFLQASVDYAGPYLLKSNQLRKPTTYKAYLVVFTCMATKAVHLELASDLTTDTFLAAFKRFQNRRGACTDIYSDNGTNFVGADNELKHFQQLMEKEEDKIVAWAVSYNTKWHFVPPASPHFNGLCEAAVKSVKFHLRRVLGQTLLRYEELNTLLIQIEGLLNSRPLCDALEENIEALTPAHFIIGQPITVPSEPNITHLKLNQLSRWQMVQQMFQHVSKRWQAEYLTTLNRLSKWRFKRDIKIGDVIILKDDNIPPGQWALGRIQNIHPGRDSIVRVVTIKTSKGLFKRPITKICLLPLINSSNSLTEAPCRKSTSE